MGTPGKPRHGFRNSRPPERQRRRDPLCFPNGRRDRLLRPAIHSARPAAVARRRERTTPATRSLMNSRKLPRPDQVKHLSEIECRFIMLARRQRAHSLRLLRRTKASACKNGNHAMMIVACAMALLATTANAQNSYSAPELFNQANTAQRANRLGRAILGYERARLISPNEPSIEQNLRIAREKARVNPPAIPAWQRLAYWLSFDGWALLGSSA